MVTGGTRVEFLLFQKMNIRINILKSIVFHFWFKLFTEILFLKCEVPLQ